jgi:hypothetical protein
MVGFVGFQNWLVFSWQKFWQKYKSLFFSKHFGQHKVSSFRQSLQFGVLIGEVRFFSNRSGSHKVFGLWSKAKSQVKFSQVCVVLVFIHRFGQRAGCLTKRAPDVWDSAAFQAFFWLWVFLHLKPFPRPPTRG